MVIWFYFVITQVDIFSIEAVSLGKLKKVMISHDGTGPGKMCFFGKKKICFENLLRAAKKAGERKK